MVLHITDSSKNYRLRPCPHCGGRLYWDKEDREWRCLNCAREPERPVSTTDNLISSKKIPISTIDNPQTKAIEKIPVTPAISRGRLKAVPYIT